MYVCVCVLGTRMLSACTRSGEKGKCVECDDGTFIQHASDLKQCFPCTPCRSGNSAGWLYTIDWNRCGREINIQPFQSAPSINSDLTRCFSCCFLRSGNCKAVHSHSKCWMSVQIGKILRSWWSVWGVQEVFKVSRCKPNREHTWCLVHSKWVMEEQLETVVPKTISLIFNSFLLSIIYFFCLPPN